MEVVVLRKSSSSQEVVSSGRYSSGTAQYPSETAQLPPEPAQHLFHRKKNNTKFSRVESWVQFMGLQWTAGASSIGPLLGERGGPNSNTDVFAGHSDSCRILYFCGDLCPKGSAKNKEDKTRL
jgi:hypothetical protein